MAARAAPLHPSQLVEEWWTGSEDHLSSAALLCRKGKREGSIADNRRQLQLQQQLTPCSFPRHLPPTLQSHTLFFSLRKALPDRDASGAVCGRPPRVRVSRMRRCGSTRLPACRRINFAGVRGSPPAHRTVAGPLRCFYRRMSSVTCMC